MTNLCPRCHRPFAESSDAWMKMAGSDNPDLPQKKNHCGAVGEIIHGKALANCEKWEMIFLRVEVERLKDTLEELEGALTYLRQNSTQAPLLLRDPIGYAKQLGWRSK